MPNDQKTKRRGAEVAEVRREGLNGDIIKISKKQCTEEMKPMLREPLRSLRLR